MKKLASLFIIVGIVFLAIFGYQYYQIQAAGQQSLEQAEQALSTERFSDGDALDVDEFEASIGDSIGLLSIDTIDATLPIVAGTNPDELDKGVGHHSSTAYPGQNDQILLSGHRDTVFTRLGEVEVGDIISVELPYGTFEYEMVDSKIVDADDTTVIGSTAPDEELIISTCYPFGYLGNAPDRYVLYAVPYEE
ncbi:sortase A [Pelagirhabdus alkalitolerans]|uniref:Sortase A n=1 Tax=Pelagirhabdus alkalitolerans TaxID=1612202 RepID=A0A1G6L3D1_9BACI|nr:class D sortase [Pelagirhabdus alkalitolerans]SDC37663.1 sortase A [Pelagirhabdus alkalitolerans]